MKKNNSIRIAIIVMALTLITSCFVGTTFAKYATQISGTGTAKVATFAVSAFGGEEAPQDSVTINVFDASEVYNIAENETYASGTNDTNVEDGNGTAIIAPGTWGMFTFDVTNDSEVTVKYSVAFTQANAEVPLEWSRTPSVENSWKTDITALNIAASESTVLGMTDDTNSDDIVIYWRWAIGTTDNGDTTLGLAGTATPSATITVSFEQVD